MSARGLWLSVGLLGVLGVVLSQAWVSDDAFITFRVIDNFVNGYGLRWNVDERVEVYTHPLWMLLLACLLLAVVVGCEVRPERRPLDSDDDDDSALENDDTVGSAVDGDGIDQNCDGVAGSADDGTDFYADDGYSEEQDDRNDNTAATNPGASTSA